MARDNTSKVSYEQVHADSGYLSDLVGAARTSDEAAAALLSSSTSACSTEFILRTFDDTLWDVERSGVQLTRAINNCRDIVAQIKTPTRFPIIPLDETLARARAEAARQVPEIGFPPATNQGRGPVPQQENAVDSGTAKTRAAIGRGWFEPIDPDFSKKRAEEKVQFRKLAVASVCDADLVVGQSKFQPKKIMIVNRSGQANAVAKEGFEPLDPERTKTRAQEKFKRTELPVDSPGRTCAALNKFPLTEPAVDGFGRTRAASKKIREQVLDSDVWKNHSRKRKSDEVT